MGKLNPVIILSVLLSVLLADLASSAIIGVSPSIARFPKMIKEGYAETPALITTSTEETIRAHFTVEGDIADWVKFDPDENNFTFSRDRPYAFNLIIQPGADAKNGNYSGVVKVTTDELATVDSGAGSSVIAQIAMLIYIEVIGDEIIQCRAGAISAYNSEVNSPFRIKATVFNDGNVRLRPEVIVDVWDQYQTQIIYTKTFFGDQILPTKSREISEEIENTLPIGQYFAEINFRDCQVAKLTTFDVVEKGSIADSGELIGIRTNDIVKVKETYPILPMFRNNGNRKVVAQFKGEIRNLKTNKIEKVLESDSLEVDPGSTIEFQLYHTADKAGEYQISGRVVYNNKITFNEQSKIIKVTDSSGITLSGILYIMLYFIIGLVIMILIAKIKKAKKRRKF